MRDTVTPELQGHCDPAFAAVRDTIASTPVPFGRGGGAISAYVDGELVLDLWGGWAAPQRPWSANTRLMIASLTKVWTATVVQRLIEQDVLQLDTPLCHWWPEFAAHGKEAITLRDVMLHTAGVLGFAGEGRLYDGDGSGWGDYDAIARGLADETPSWTPGTRHGYHAVSYGWLLNEVVRRATGQTIGTIFRSDVAEPLGLASSIGTTGADAMDVAHVLLPDPRDLAWMPRQMENLLLTKARKTDTLVGKAFIGDGRTSIMDRSEGLMKQQAFLAAEVPASNGTSTARSLAKLFAAFAAGGEIDGVRVLSERSVNLMSQVQVRSRDVVVSDAMPRWMRAIMPAAGLTYGLMPNDGKESKRRFGPDPQAIGGAGFGGQWAMADPNAKLSIASLRSAYTPASAQPGFDELSTKVRQAIYRCL